MKRTMIEIVIFVLIVTGLSFAARYEWVSVEHAADTQVYGQKQRWTRTIYLTSPDTIPDDTLFLSNNTNATLTIDTIKVRHNNSSTADVSFYVRRDTPDSTGRFTMLALSNKDSIYTETTITRATVNKYQDLGIGEMTLDGSADGTWASYTFIGSFTVPEY